jgi:cytochrome c553
MAAMVLANFGFTAVTSAQAQRQPDPRHGEVIAAQGTAAGAPTCAQCHAFNGVSDGRGAFPRTAGQSKYYLAQQPRDFVSRLNAFMSQIATALSPDAAYYANIDAPFMPLKPAGPALLKRGKEIAMVGDTASDVQNGDNCHGPDGAGEPPAIPYLAGQYASYIAIELNIWRKGFRKNSPESMAVAKHLDPQDMAAIVAHYQQVRSPLGEAANVKPER